MTNPPSAKTTNNLPKNGRKTKAIDEDIVVSGMSGQFPCSKNIQEFEHNLYNKVDMVSNSEHRYARMHPEVPKYIGLLPDLGKFDATFFGIHSSQADYIDPQIRMLMEEAFKAIMDAGINPSSLRGSNTGVYVGACVSETERQLYYDNQVPFGYGITGCSKAMFANRISYALGLKGPSTLIDTACSSSMFGLNLAYQAFKCGAIDAAIVAGSNLCLDDKVTLQFYLLGVLTTKKCRPFDEEASGYTRAEAVSCVFLQRKSQARRVYATLVSSATNCDGFKIEGITYPSNAIQERLLRSVYADTKFSIDDLGFMEAHSTGTVVGDPEECKAIDSAICSQRSEPLLVGSIKSNCGHAEAASGVCSIVKVILTLESGLIPPNINLTTLRKEIPSLQEGRLQVVTEPTKLLKPYIGINSFGFGGANAHALFKQFEREKQPQTYYDYPRLFTWSGRTEENVYLFLNDLEKRPLDDELLTLAHSAQEGGIQGMVYRGFSLLKSPGDNQNAVAICKSVQHHKGIKRPIVWVFSGMGSQWTGMGRDLMHLPQFRESIQKSHQTLQPFGVDVFKIITADDPHIFDNILHCFVGIAATQIALVDLLRTLDITPDFIIGHSVGELGCAYADNCFTAEQMILAAYYRGKVSLETEKIKGSMAAIGMGYNDIKDMLPPSIEVACHNSKESCTISGPCEDIAKFIAELTAKKIFAREVPCSNIAYHSKYIAQFGPKLLKHLREIITSPKPRSKKWISTSVPRSLWLQNEGLYSSAEYHTNNLLNSVLLEEGLIYIPKNALTIEVAPHALLLSILKSALGDGVHVGLTRRNAEDNTNVLLSALGSLYMHGLEFDAGKLYPPISWPVSRGTGCISHLIDFDHTHEHYVYSNNYDTRTEIQVFELELTQKYEFIAGHRIDGRVLVPATFYLECVWQSFVQLRGNNSSQDNTAVEFSGVRFLRATTLNPDDKIQLIVVIQSGTGKFEVSESQSLVANGYIQEIVGKTQPQHKKTDQKASQPLTKKDFYQELKLRGYHYTDEFQAVQSASLDGTRGKISWTGNWVTFMDAMLQLSIVSQDSRNLMIPTRLRSLKIYPEYQRSSFETEQPIDAVYDKIQNKITAGGVEIVGLTANTILRRKAPGDPVLEGYQFVPHFPAPTMNLDDIARCCIQLVLENLQRSKLQLIEFEKPKQGSQFLQKLLLAVGDLPLITGTCVLYHDSKDGQVEEIPGISHVYPGESLSSVSDSIVVMHQTDVARWESSILQHIEDSGYLILRDQPRLNIEKYNAPQGFEPIAFFPTTAETIVLLHRQMPVSKEATFLKLSSADMDFKWLKQLQALVKSSKPVTLVAQHETLSGILGLVNCLRKEPETSNIRCIFIDDPKAPAFDPNTPFYANQIKRGLGINVYRKGTWGTYRHLLLAEERVTQPQTASVHGDITRIGDLSSLTWLQSSSSEQHTTKVMYASLNFRDIMLASGRLAMASLGNRLQQNNVFGFEYSGINIQTGKAEMGMVAKNAVSSYLQHNANLTWEVPQKWSLREAATVPVVYLTVYYAFFFVTDIRKKKSILIHAGSGGVGIAAIRVALAYGLEVYTTVSTAEKKAFLLKTFPSLKENHIGNSRDTSFEEMITEQTVGKGVDLVLNSLSEDKMKASIRCLGRKGCFLEIGKFDFVNDNSLDLGSFLKELSFHAVMADNLLNADQIYVKRIKDLLAKDIANGTIQPLPSTVYKAHEIEQAFRFLMSGKHIGKVLIQVHEDAKSAATLPIAVLPQIYFAPELVYVVPGGLGGFGLELVDWMIIRGARKVVLSSSRGISNTYQQLRITVWKSYGAEILINTNDISTTQGCHALLTEATKLGPVGGIFNLAVVLKDAVFDNQTSEQFLTSFGPKALATKYLDELSRKLCPKLHHFVIFSSVSCGRGNAGQTNYGMANSIMERIIEDRVAHGLPGKAIQWGAVGEVGLVAQMAEGKIDLEIGGTLQQRISSCLEVLDALMTSPTAIVSSMVVAEKKIQLAGLTPVQFVLQTLSIKDAHSVSMSSTLAELGMDSLMGVEIKQILERDFDIELSAPDLRTLTLDKLSKLSEGQNAAEKMDKVASKENGGNVMHKFFNAFTVDADDLNFAVTGTFDRLNDISTGTPIIIIPGIDGVSGKIWHKIAAGLKFPTYVWQINNDCNAETMKDTVQRVYQDVLEFLSKRGDKTFRILAYSMGAAIAHPLIEQLEEHGYSGKAIYVDGSPQWLATIREQIRATMTEDEFLKVVAVNMVISFVPSLDSHEVTRSLRSWKDWRELLNCYLLQHKHKNIELCLKSAHMVLARSKMIYNTEKLKSTAAIQSPLLILRATNGIVDNIDEYYGLGEHAANKLSETINGTHSSILHTNQLVHKISQFFG